MDVQNQQEQHWSYEGSPWIHVPEWAVQSHVNSETSEPFWSVRIPKGTTIEHNGQTLDVGQYRFTTNVEPALTYGEEGSLKAVRGIHFPTGWEITLERFENVAKPDHEPIFEKTDCIKEVTPKELADGLTARAAAWKLSHKKSRDEHSLDNDSELSVLNHQKTKQSQDLSL